MNIYFAGSIRGGEGDTDIYSSLIEHLQHYGTVLTMHTGDGDTGAGLPDEEIFTQDSQWLNDASVVIAEITQPSLGVGYAIGLAEARNKPIMCLYRPLPDRKISAMMSGNKKLHLHSYTNLTDARECISNFFDVIGSQ